MEIEIPETTQEDYRVFTYWSNGFYYKYRAPNYGALHSHVNDTVSLNKKPLSTPFGMASDSHSLYSSLNGSNLPLKEEAFSYHLSPLLLYSKWQ